VAAAAGAATAATRDSLCWQVEGSGFYLNNIIQEKFNLKIFS
jgi:hypothetical protein